MRPTHDWRRCIGSGLASGEGIIHHIRDPLTATRKARTKEEKLQADGYGLITELVDGGVEDKRLMVLVSEFASVLAVAARKDNSLSPTLRDLWDRRDARTMSKNSPERCTGALVSIIAHITPAEPRARLDSTEIANGFANRFLFVASRRSKLLSHGGNVPRNLVSEFGIGLAEVIRFAHNVSEVDMTDEAWLLWDARYARLTNRPPGLVGAITGRAGAIVRRLAMLYALLDGRPSVSPTPDDPSREP